MEAEEKHRESRRRKKRTENANEAEMGSVTAAQCRSPHNHTLQKAQKEKKRGKRKCLAVYTTNKATRRKKKDPLTQNIHFFQKPSSTCTVSSNQKSIPCVRACTFRYKSPLSSLTSSLATGLLSVEFFVVPAGDSCSGSLKSWRMSSLSFA